MLRPLALHAALGLSLLCTSCVYSRIFYYNTPTLAAPSYFDARAVPASHAPTPLATAAEEAPFDITDSDRATYRSFDDLLESNATVAFLAIRDDQLVYERYFGDVGPSTLLPTFSMSKTFAAVLVGCAIDDHLLASPCDPIVRYLPELSKKSGYDAITIDELLRMTSGIDFDEESTAGAALYYCTDLRDRMYGYDVTSPPGRHYLYGSVNIELLWDALHRRLGGRTVADYFDARVWDPLGAEHAASWSLDSKESGIEKLFGGFNATARDTARLGLLFLHRGAASGREVVPEAWVERSILPDPVAGVVHTSDGDVKRGYYQWFLTMDGRAFFAKGYHGQYVFVVPEKRMVFVRFGEGYGDVDWPRLFLRLADAR